LSLALINLVDIERILKIL